MAKPQTELQAGLQGVLNQLPSLLLNYRLQQDAQIKSLSTKSAESILANSANYTSQEQFTNSRDHINNMFNSHAGDPAMQAVKLTALEALSNTENSFIHREDASADLSVLNRKANKYIGQLRTEGMGEVINDITAVLDENKTYMDRSTFASAKSQLDDYIDWYTVAKPVMAADTDPDTIGLQADENIMKAGTLLSMNRTDEAVKWYMKSGVSTANNAKDQIKNAVGTSLRVNIRGMNGLNTANADPDYTKSLIHDIQLPAMGDIDAASVPMYKDMFQDNVNNVVSRSSWGQPMLVDGNPTPYDETANGVIEYLKDSGVWGNMAASANLLRKKIDLPGWQLLKGEEKKKENLYSVRHFLFQLDALDKLDQSELMIGNVNKTSKSSIQGTISSILNSDEEANQIAQAKSAVATAPITPNQVIQTGPNSYKSTTQKVVEDPLVQMLNDIERRKLEEKRIQEEAEASSIMFNTQAKKDADMSSALEALNKNMRSVGNTDNEDMVEAGSMPIPLSDTLMGGNPGFPDTPDLMSPDEAGIISRDKAIVNQERAAALSALNYAYETGQGQIDPSQIRRTSPNLEPSTALVPEGEAIVGQTPDTLPKKNRGESNQEYVDSLNLDGESEFAATIKNIYKESEAQESDNIKAELAELYKERSAAFLSPSFNANSKKIKAIDNKIAKLEAAQVKAIDIMNAQQSLSSDEQIDTIILEMFNNQGDYLPKGMKKFKSLNKFLDYLNSQQ